MIAEAFRCCGAFEMCKCETWALLCTCVDLFVIAKLKAQTLKVWIFPMNFCFKFYCDFIAAFKKIEQSTHYNARVFIRILFFFLFFMKFNSSIMIFCLNNQNNHQFNFIWNRKIMNFLKQNSSNFHISHIFQNIINFNAKK